MNHDEITKRVRHFVLNHFPLARQQEVGDDDSLLDGGIIDSLGILEVVTYLETEFQIALSDDEMVSDNFQSIASMARFAGRKVNDNLAITPEG